MRTSDWCHLGAHDRCTSPFCTCSCGCDKRTAELHDHTHPAAHTLHDTEESADA